MRPTAPVLKAFAYGHEKARQGFEPEIKVTVVDLTIRENVANTLAHHIGLCIGDDKPVRFANPLPDEIIRLHEAGTRCVSGEILYLLTMACEMALYGGHEDRLFPESYGDLSFEGRQQFLFDITMHRWTTRHNGGGVVALQTPGYPWGRPWEKVLLDARERHGRRNGYYG